MKQSFLVVIALLCSITISAQNIAVKGSDTMLPLVKELAETYMHEHNNCSVNVSGGGSVYGIEGLQNGSAQIAMCSRSLTSQEVSSLPSINKVTIAFDALTIIVHSSNNVDHLSQHQLELIFSGVIKNWKEVGGIDMPIQVLTRNEKSGTCGFLKKKVLKGKAITANAKVMNSNASIVDRVSETRGAIGYVGLAHVVEAVKPLAVSWDGKNYIRPTFKNAIEKKYPIMRPLYYYFNGSDAQRLKGFQEFTLSSEGQRIASFNGYIPAR
ncbi:MAG: phosphate ABC transporter substrate-binding protein [Flammeovirgaceae bacterium]